MKQNFTFLNRATLFALLLLGIVSSSYAQIVTINTNGTSPNQIGVSNFHISEQVYTNAEIGNSNFSTVGAEITSMAFFANTLSTLAGGNTFNNVKVYLKNVVPASATPYSFSAFATGAWNSTYATSNGYTLVYDGPITFTAVGGAATVFQLSTPFLRVAGNNLNMLIERTDNTLHTGFVSFCANTLTNGGAATSSVRRTNAATLPTTFAQLSGFRTAVEFRHVYADDAQLRQVFTLGKIPIPYATPHTVQAILRNTGSAPLTNKVVTLDVTGANSYSTSVAIDVVDVGKDTTVTFSPFNPTALGINTVTVSTSADEFNGNNSFSMSQLVTNNSYSLAYQGQGSAGGVGFNGATGDFVGRFPVNAPSSINQVSVNFNVGGQPFKIGIWRANGPGGAPDSLLWESASLTSTAGIYTVPVSPRVDVSGAFCVGVRQTGTANVSFSYQSENPVRKGSYFFTSPTGGTIWNDFNTTASPFRFMVEPRLTLANDMGVSSITTPAGGSIGNKNCNSIAPAVEVSNFGEFDQIDVKTFLEIKKGAVSVYKDTVTIPFIVSGTTTPISFKNFYPDSLAGTTAYTAESGTLLATDGDNTNNNVTSNFTYNQPNSGLATALYQFTNSSVCGASSSPNPATYSWITQTSNEIIWPANNGDDAFSDSIFMPLKFNYFGVDRQAIWISSNGFFTFLNPTGVNNAGATLTIPDVAAPNAYIAGAMTNLDMSPTTYPDTHVYHGGDADQYVVTFWHAHKAGAPTTEYITFQIIMKWDGSIKLQYNDTESSFPYPTSILDQCTVGFESATGTNGLQYRLNGAGGPMFGSPMAVEISLLTPLPLSMTTFAAKATDKGNIVEWTTERETEIETFLIERSISGDRSFVTIGQVAPLNRNSRNNYTFMDSKPLSQGYYRLKVVENDGRFSYSNVVAVGRKKEFTINDVYPNPTANDVNLRFSATKNEGVTISIVDALGSMVYNQAYDGNAGVNEININTTNFATGIYKIIVDNGAERLFKDFVIQR